MPELLSKSRLGFDCNLVLILISIVLVTSGFAKNNNNINLFESIIKKDKMTIGISFDSKPFGFKDSNGQIQGVEADLAREIAKRTLGSENRVVFKNVAPQDRINAVNSGSIDMVISTMTISPQRNKTVDFSDPYFIAGQVICVRKDSKIDSIDDLINKKVIVILGTTGEKNITHFAPNALIQGYADNAEAINAFKSGVGDAITTDDALLQGLVMGNAGYSILPIKLTREPYGIAFKKSRHTKSLRINVNKIIKAMNLDGSLEAIKSKWGVS